MKKKSFCTEDKKVLYVNSKTGVAHCILDCTIDVAPDNDDDIPWSLVTHLRDKYNAVLEQQYGSIFRARIETQAVCHGGDVFDAKKGKTIAYSKAQLKLYHLCKRVFADMQAFFDKKHQEYSAVQEMFKRYRAREYNFVKSI